MKHRCHCHFRDQVKKFKAGKLGLLGGFLIIGHLLFHVAECLIIPAIIVAINRQDAEAIEALNPSETQTTTFKVNFGELQNRELDFSDALEYARPLRR